MILGETKDIRMAMEFFFGRLVIRKIMPPEVQTEVVRRPPGRRPGALKSVENNLE